MPTSSDGGGSHYDVVVLGGGSAAETVCQTLRDEADAQDLRIAVVEKSRVGGICPFVACMPSKALLRSAGVRHLAALADDTAHSGSNPPRSDSSDGYSPDAYRRAVERRDDVADHRDDSEHADDLKSAGVTLIRGTGSITGPGRLHVDVRAGQPLEITWDDLVVATGSAPSLPPLDGLPVEGPKRELVWTSDDALTSTELPRSLAVLGGGAVGCELAQMFARFGVQVTLVEPEDRLLAQEEPEVGAMLAGALESEGIRVRLAVKPIGVEPGDAGIDVLLEDGSRCGVERILVAAGRDPSTSGLGLESLGIQLGEKGELPVTDVCRVEGVDHVYACGDVTGRVPFTHGAKHEARVVAHNIAACRGLTGRRESHQASGQDAGHQATVKLDTVPRTVYTDPPVASVGLTREKAAERGLKTEFACFDVGDTARAVTEGLRGPKDADGVLVLVADREQGTLIGAAAAAPHADEWISEATLAIAAAIPLSSLSELVHPFPTFAESYESALRQLAKKVGGRAWR